MKAYTKPIESKHDMNTINCIIDGQCGIHIPQWFAEKFDLSKWSGINADDIDIIKSGSDHELYWEAWDEVMSDAKYIDDYGITWTLYQDGDLFAVSENHKWDEEVA